MARCYSACVRHRYPPRSLPALLPAVWLVSDERIDDRIEAAIRRLPRGSGFIFRHYHLPPDQRRMRFEKLARLARARGHVVILSGSAREVKRWGADGAYGAALKLTQGPAALRLVTAHSLNELRAANAMRADVVLLSPVFATGTHPGARGLGPVRFRLLAVRALAPVIALGGMDADRARRMDARRWAAIASLAQPRRRAFPIHS